MTDDNDIENYGLDWSGYVNYKDAWGTDPENVFANFSLIEKHGISPSYIASKEKLDPLKRQNLIGIQGQLWTETVISSTVLDELVFPNMVVFAEQGLGNNVRHGFKLLQRKNKSLPCGLYGIIFPIS